TGLSVVQRKIPEVISLKEKRQIGVITRVGRESVVTVIVRMSAVGTYSFPIIIFPRKNFRNLLVKGAPLGTIFTCQPSGWTNSNVFCDWFDHFIYSVKPTRSELLLLVPDGQHSHTSSIDRQSKSQPHEHDLYSSTYKAQAAAS
ncbi:hypothetical protein Cfor_00743, partial [Coptotermes formosanus]